MKDLIREQVDEGLKKHCDVSSSVISAVDSQNEVQFLSLIKLKFEIFWKSQSRIRLG